MKKTEPLIKAKRAGLFEPGRYSSLPDVILRDPSLSASAKLVWMALAGHLGPSGTEVWPSITRLSRMTGLGKNTVLRAVEALTDANLIVVQRREPGKSNRYRIMQPQVCLFDSEKMIGDPPKEPAKKRSQNGTSPKMGPVPKRDPTSPKMGPEAVPKWDPKYLKEVLKENTPPTPPQAGGSERENFSSTKKTKNKEEIIRQIDAAHVKTFGKPLPAKWKRDVRLEYADGDRAALERIDAHVLRAAETYRAAKKWNCLSHATVMQYLAHLDRQAQAKRQGNVSAKAQADAKTKADAEAAAEARRQQTEAMKFFRSLPASEQERFIARVRDRPFAPTRRPDLLAGMAALAAFSERETLAMVV